MIDFDLMYRILPKPHDKVLSVYHLVCSITTNQEFAKALMYISSGVHAGSMLKTGWPMH